MGLFDFLKPRKQKTLLDELQENPLVQQQKALFDAMRLMCEDGYDSDEIPGGTGEFGHDVNNPIPTLTPMGSISYLSRLRLSSDNAKIVYERFGSTSSPICSSIVDIYTISHPNGQALTTLYICPYHKRNSNKAPKGFFLLGL